MQQIGSVVEISGCTSLTNIYTCTEASHSNQLLLTYKFPFNWKIQFHLVQLQWLSLPTIGEGGMQLYNVQIPIQNSRSVNLNVVNSFNWLLELNSLPLPNRFFFTFSKVAHITLHFFFVRNLRSSWIACYGMEFQIKIFVLRFNAHLWHPIVICQNRRGFEWNVKKHFVHHCVSSLPSNAKLYKIVYFWIF